MRKLATIRKIDSINPIEGADAIECAVVGGWTTVIKKGDFKVDDLVVYCEIDSWIPNSIAPFLSKGHEPREYMGVPGERLRTVKLRGQVSQGLILHRYVALDKVGEIYEGMDVSDLLNINKYEPPVSAQLAGQMSGGFPSFIPKTDQERIQNLTRDFDRWKERGYTWEETEKLDGSSMTVFIKDGNIGVCSRNWELKETEGNTLWALARQGNLLETVFKHMGMNVAFQGEVIGPGIQGNKYKLTKHEFHIYDMYDIDAQRYFSPAQRHAIVYQFGLTHVPAKLDATSFVGVDVNSLIASADGESLVGAAKPKREGLVFKCNEAPASFKVISNSFLLKSE